MQELKFVVADSDASSLVMRAVDPAVGGPIAEYFLPVTDELRAFLSDAPTASAGSASVEAEGDAPSGTSESSGTDTASTTSTADAAADAADARQEEQAATPAEEETTETEVAPLFQGRGQDRPNARPHRTRISMSPRVIQDRIRHGATVAELADEADTDESRIEPYAWPILQERARIAELAHAALPVNGDGVSNQPLWEVLATALAAHGESLSDAEWDAYQNTTKQWIVTVSWEKDAAGRTNTHTAEFIIELRGSEKALAHPHNSIAGDLVNPRYGQPVRSVSPVTPLLHPTQTPEDQHWEDDQADWGRQSNRSDAAGAPEAPAAQDTPPAGGDSPAERGGRGDNEFLMHPDTKAAKPKRKRKAVTPHWEDVLLGVRTNPKKKN
ncbi:septation protein SepH [uncultured Corynebacterium sp.]|uniref:septation protein SepH n=1 Tax=uncultured Corynebacterium sp. TaxID=159447 RepID=UPI0025DE39B4|nr:septation protein SepH [uncultured Corynebacterium sp.]